MKCLVRSVLGLSRDCIFVTLTIYRVDHALGLKRSIRQGLGSDPIKAGMFQLIKILINIGRPTSTITGQCFSYFWIDSFHK